jgi:hypothetical protein
MPLTWTLDYNGPNEIRMNDPHPDASGATWWVTGTSGWFDSPSLRQTIIDRDLSSGSLMASSVLDRRTVHLSGTARVVGTEDNVWRSRDRLLAALTTLASTKVLAVNEGGIIKTQAYWAGGAVSISIEPGGLEFDIPMVMEDPAKYSPYASFVSNITTGSPVVVSPLGSYDTYPVMTVTGITPLVATYPIIRITGSAQSGSANGYVSFGSYVPAANETKLVIDFVKKTIVGMNSSNVVIANRYGNAVVKWFPFQFGGNDLSYIGPPGTSLTASYKDAWL